DRMDAERGEPEIRGLAAARTDRAQAPVHSRRHEDHHLQRRAARRDEAADRHLEPIRGQAALAHVPEEWEPVFRMEHAQTSNNRTPRIKRTLRAAMVEWFTVGLAHGPF